LPQSAALAGAPRLATARLARPVRFSSGCLPWRRRPSRASRSAPDAAQLAQRQEVFGGAAATVAAPSHTGPLPRAGRATQPLTHPARWTMRTDNRGFTLIELLIVVVIIGILASIAIPKFANTKEKAYVAKMKGDLRNLATAQESYSADNQVYYGGAVPNASLTYNPSSGV